MVIIQFLKVDFLTHQSKLLNLFRKLAKLT